MTASVLLHLRPVEAQNETIMIADCAQHVATQVLRTAMAVLMLTGPMSALAQTPTESEILAVVQNIFDGINTGDSVVLSQAMHENSTLVAIPDQAPPRTTSRAQFLAQIHGRSGLYERMWEPQVRIHGRIATVWAPYDFHVDGEFSHCGVDAFHLVFEGERWQVLTITYTRQTTGCAPSPLGPIG